MTDLGSLGGHYLVGLAINNSGEIAGYGDLPDGTYHAFRWTQAGGLEDLGANGGWLSQAVGINDNGDVVGVYLDAFNDGHGFVAPRNGVMRDLRTPERPIVNANSITSDGRITGWMISVVPEFHGHAFRTSTDGTPQDLGSPLYDSVGWHINDAGDVTGYESRSPNGDVQSAFRFSDAAGKVYLGTLGGLRSSGMSINNAGVIVGWSEGPMGSSQWSRAFRARPDSPLEDLGTLGGDVAGAEAVNDAGTIVGWASGPLGFSAFLYTDAEGMVDLNLRASAPGGQPMSDALAINNTGQIVVLYSGGTGTYLLTPVLDTRAPVITATVVSPRVLAPPNGRMVPVTVDVSVADDFDPAPACSITSVRNSEAPAWDRDRDVEVTGPLTVSLRARRFGSGHGRTYTIGVRCSDASGNAATSTALVHVPHGHDDDDRRSTRER